MAALVTALRHGHLGAPQLGARIPRAFVAGLGLAVLLAGSIALGVGVAGSDTLIADHGDQLLWGLLGVVGLALVAAGPIVCIAAIAALGASGYDDHVARIGHVDIQAADVFFVALLAWLFVRAVQRLYQPDREQRATRLRFGQWFALAFLAYTGLTIWHVALVQSDLVSHSLVSFLRLAQTASLALVMAVGLRSRRDVRIVLAAIALGGTAGVISACVDAAGALSTVGSERIGGWLGVNAVGLVGGALIAIGAFAGLGPRKDYRIALVVIGLLGLLLGKSVAAIIGVALMLAVGASLRRPAEPLRRVGALITAVGVMAVFVFGVVQLVRPSAAPGTGGYRDSSTSQRVIVGAAGLEMFTQHPLIGVGWRRSDDPSVIGDPKVVQPVRERFQGAKEYFFPDVTPTTVHNSYIQVLAELGLVGAALFLLTLGGIFAATRRLLRRLSPGDPLRDPAWTAAMTLLLALVWLNDNPLYGGQVETIMVAVSIGILAAIARMVGRRDSGTPAG